MPPRNYFLSIDRKTKDTVRPHGVSKRAVNDPNLISVTCAVRIVTSLDKTSNEAIST